MRQFLLITLLAIAYAISPALAQTYNRHVMVVLDDSGTVQDESGNGALARPSFMTGRRALIGHLADTYKDDTLITLLSVNRSQVIWQGSAKDMTKRNNFVLAEFLNKGINGCADFLRVMRTIDRELRYASAPLGEMIFFSSLVHTGAYDEDAGGCSVDPDQLEPPAEFFDRLADIHSETEAKITFYWAYDEVAPIVSDRFDEKNIRVFVLPEKRTMAELVQ